MIAGRLNFSKSLYRASMRYTLCVLCLLFLAPGLLHGDPFFGRDTRDFDLMYNVTGYERDTLFREPAAIALDTRQGLVYVADTGAESVDVFTLHGVPRHRLDRRNEIKSPIGLALDGDGRVYVSDAAGGPIKIIDSDGQIETLEIPVDEEDEPAKPGRMTFDRHGNLYVVDRANCRVYVFDKDREVSLRIGGIGDKRGEFKSLQDVAVDRQGRIYALDASGAPVQVFDRNGKYIYRFGFRGDGPQDIALPVGLFIDRNDQIWVVDKGQHALKVFDRSGSFLRRFGVYGVETGTLFQPIDAVMDDFGHVYVLEAGGRRLQVFSLSRPFEPLIPPEL